MRKIVLNILFRTKPYLHLAWPLCALLGAILLWANIAGNARIERQAARALLVQQTATYAQAYALYLTRSIAQMDQVTMQLKHSWEHARRTTLLEDMKAAGMFSDAAFVHVSVLDSKGMVRSSTRAQRGANFATADFFTAHRDSNSSALRIGAAPAGDAAQALPWHGRDVVLLTRRLDSGDDEFDGVVLMAIDAGYFTAFGSTAMLGRTGVLGAVGGDGQLRIERSAHGSPRLGSAGASADGIDRMLGEQASTDYPVTALVALGVDEALAPAAAHWRETRNNALVTTGALAVLALLASMLTVRAAARAREQQEVAHAAQTARLVNEDSLTGLPNRHAFLQFAQHALERAQQEGIASAMLFIDLDDFKQVNDTHGHGAGDCLLQAAAGRLQSVLRPQDRVARFGGDEFVVLLDRCDGPLHGAAVAERIIAAFAQPFPIGDGAQALVGASVGIALAPHDGVDAGTLIQHADMAMYAGKNDGKGQYRFFDHAISHAARARMQLKQRLVEAIDAGLLVLHYQPRVDTRSSALRSMEALLRWHDPVLGHVSPAAFIPVAEAGGLILRIGELVIEQACAQIAAWRRAGLDPVPVSINISPKQFMRRGLARQVEAALARHQVPASLLQIEITESAMLGEQDDVAAELAALRALGVALYVDDFGTGYSSLSQLQRLRMDGLKVDRAFTAQLGVTAEGKVFFQAIVSMAHALGMSVVAEGVETRAELDVLAALRCDEVQGYLIDRPMPPERMADLLQHRLAMV